jgi:hypothetical protein
LAELANEPPSPPPPSLLNLSPQQLNSDVGNAASHQAGLFATRGVAVQVALRTAMHLVGDFATPLSSECKSWLADRYIHQRAIVDHHTAGALLLDAFVNSRVFVLHE